MLVARRGAERGAAQEVGQGLVSDTLQSAGWCGRVWFPGAHSQGHTLEELNQNLAEVVAMLLDDGWR